MDSSFQRILVEKNFEIEESIEQYVEKVFDEFVELFMYEAEENNDNKGNEKILKINSLCTYCNMCYNHIYCHTDFNDINSFFQNHINTDYHKSMNIINKFKKGEPVIEWEEIGFTGFCKVCEISGLYATLFKSNCDSLVQKSHTCKKSNSMKEFFGIFSKKEILLKFFSLQLFQDKFIKNSDNCSFCLLCEIEIKNSTKTVKYHLVGELHYDTFLDFIQLNFKFTSFDLLNGFNMEEVIRWTLQHNLQFNTTNFKLYDEKKTCIEISNRNLNNLGRNLVFSFTPKIIENMLKLHVSDLIVNNSCLVCKKKNITLEHFNSETHEKELIQEILKNKSIFELYLNNCEKRLEPYKRDIEIYKDYRNFIEVLNKQDSKTSDKKKKNSLDTAKAINKENFKLNVIDGKTDSKYEVKSYRTNGTNIKKKQHNIKKEEKYEALTNENKFKEDPEMLKNVDYTNSANKDLSKKLQSHLVGKKQLSENVILEMKRANNGHIENFLMVSDLPKKVKWEEVYRKLLCVGEVKHVFFKKNKRFIFFEDSKIINNTAEWQTITIGGKKVPITHVLKKNAEKILTKHATTMPNSVSNEEIIKSNKAEAGNIQQQKLNEKDSSNKKKKINLTEKENSKAQNIEQIHLDKDMCLNNKKGTEECENHLRVPGEKGNFKKVEKQLNSELERDLGRKFNFKVKNLSQLCDCDMEKKNEQNDNFLLIHDLPKKINPYKVFIELLKFGEIDSVYFKKKRSYIIFSQNPDTYSTLADRQHIVVDEKTIPISIISKDQVKHILNKQAERYVINEKLKSLLSKPDKLVTFTMNLLKNSLKISGSKEEREREKIICAKVLEVASKQSSFQVKHIICFGSRISGLCSNNSDLDILLDCDNMYALGDKWTKSSQKKMAFCFSNLLKSHRDFTNIQCVANAKVPIVKFLEKSSNLNCDLSFKNGLSVENTKLLKFLFSLDFRVKPLILFLKFWLKSNGIHGRPRFSSYAVSLMVIFYLQQLPLPVLPDIETLKKNFVGRRLTLGGWDCSFTTDISCLKTVKNLDPFLKLLHGFFEFYSKFDFSQFIVSPLTGTPIPRASFSQPVLLPLAYKRHVHNIPLQRLCNEKELICVIDPFDLSHNVTDNFTKNSFEVFLNSCKLSFELLGKSMEETKYEFSFDLNNELIMDNSI